MVVQWFHFIARGCEFVCLHVLPMGFLPNADQQHAHRVDGRREIAPQCEPLSSLPHLHTRLYFSGLAARQQRPHVILTPLRTNKRSSFIHHARSISAPHWPFHMTEVECEIPAQTFMRADLHYITSEPHHGRLEGERGVRSGLLLRGSGGEQNSERN